MLLGRIFIHYNFEVFCLHFGADRDRAYVQALQKPSGVLGPQQSPGLWEPWVKAGARLRENRVLLTAAS